MSDWKWVLGLDFGIRDFCGATVIGWRTGDPVTYIPRSYRFKADPPEAALEVRRLEQDYEFVQIVGDLGGLGAAFGSQMAQRYGIPIVAAKKADKQGHIRLFNGALRHGMLKVVRSGCLDLLEEWRNLPWREDGTREAEGYTCDASDSALYAYMATYAYHERVPDLKPTLEQRLRAEEAAMMEKLEAEAEREQGEQWWER